MTRDTLSEYKAQLDKSLTTVMPDSWQGHARLAILQASNLSESQKMKAIHHIDNLADEHPEHFDNFGPLAVATKVVGELAE